MAAQQPPSHKPKEEENPNENVPSNAEHKRRPSRLPTRRKVKIYTKLPSLCHLDVPPPPMRMVRMALAHFGETKRMRVSMPEYKANEFHDEKGRMKLPGSYAGYYLGDVVGNVPHGYGQHWILHSGEDFLVYDGEWNYGRKTGRGHIYYINGQEYFGDLRDGEHNGWGCMRFKDGNIYDGEWLKGRKHGQGTLYYANGNVYEGNWCKAGREGWGTFYWPKVGRKFEGEWVANDPYSGCYKAMSAEEYNFLHRDLPGLLAKVSDRLEPTQVICNLTCIEDTSFIDVHLEPVRQTLFRTPFEQPRQVACTLIVSKDNLFVKVCLEPVGQISQLKLRHPCWPIYNQVVAVRQLKEDMTYPNKLYKMQVERKICLSADQLYALKHAFEAIAPAYLHRAVLRAIHFRRLLVTARIDPDLQQGQMLLAHLEESARECSRLNSWNEVCITMSDFISSILSFCNH